MPRTRSNKSLSARAKPRYIAIIADIVDSRAITGARRRALQQRLEALLSDINRDFKPAIAAGFLITVGDEFQGLLRSAAIIPQLMRRLEAELPDIQLRAGIGCGALATDLRETAIGMDGPVWHAARAAIEDAKRSDRLGGVFQGFGPVDDLIHNGFARLLHLLRSRLTQKQRRLLDDLLANQTQKEVARRAGVSKQAVSKQARAAGVEANREAELAWRSVLERADRIERRETRT
jgi:hypothetical protein